MDCEGYVHCFTCGVCQCGGAQAVAHQSTHLSFCSLQIFVAYALDAHTYTIHQLNEWWAGASQMHDKYVDPSLPLTEKSTTSRASCSMKSLCLEISVPHRHSMQQRMAQAHRCRIQETKNGFTTLLLLKHGSATIRRPQWTGVFHVPSREELIIDSQRLDVLLYTKMHGLQV